MDCEVIDVWYCFSAERQKSMVAPISNRTPTGTGATRQNLDSSQIFFLCNPRYLNTSGHLSITDCFSSGLDCTTFGKLRIQS